MGCNVSRLDGNGATLPARQLRPLFLQRLDDFKAARRHGGGRPLKGADSTPSKKQLLFHIDDVSHHSSIINNNNPPKRMSVYNSLEDSIKKPDQKIREPINIYEKDIEMKKHITNVVDHEEEIVKGKGKNDMKEKMEDKIIEDDDFLSADEDINDGEEEDDDNDDEDEDEERNIGFPGSPSFRVYFVDRDIGKKDAFKDAISSDDSVPSKESSLSSSSSSSEKKEKRARKKRSFRKVLPKNLLNVKSCYTCSHHKKQTSQLS